MILQICVLRDSAAGVFGMPSFHATIGAAVRGFGDAVNRDEPNNVLFAHPDDFELFHIGSFEDGLARFELLESPKAIARGKDFKTQRK